MVTNTSSTDGASASTTVRVGVNGYGTVGKRIADAVAAQPDMTVCGVSKCTPSADLSTALARGYDIYTPEEYRPDIEATYPGVPLAGSVRDLIETADVVVDATPSGVGERYQRYYADTGTKAIYQGGEDRGVADASFTARVNYDAVGDAETLRVVSCNSTGLARLLDTIDDRHAIDAVTATLVRRGGDPDESSRGPINDIVPDPVTVPSHHGPDVRTVLPDLDVTTTALRVPATLMHVQSLAIDLQERATRASVIAALEEEPRIRLLEERDGLDGCAAIETLAEDAGRPRGDVWENCVWTESITVSGSRVHCLQAIDQRAIIVPENVDAIRALAGDQDATTSMHTTNSTLDPVVGALPPAIEGSTGATRDGGPGRRPVDVTGSAVGVDRPGDSAGQVPGEGTE